VSFFFFGVLGFSIFLYREDPCPLSIRYPSNADGAVYFCVTNRMANPRKTPRIPRADRKRDASRGPVAVAEDEPEGEDVGPVLAIRVLGLLVREEPRRWVYDLFGRVSFFFLPPAGCYGVVSLGHFSFTD